MQPPLDLYNAEAGRAIPADIADVACSIHALRDLLDEPGWGHGDLIDAIRSKGGGGLPLFFNKLLPEYDARLECWPSFSMFDCKRGGYYLLESRKTRRSRLLAADDRLVVTTRLDAENHLHMQCITVKDWPRYERRAVYVITARRAGRRY